MKPAEREAWILEWLARPGEYSADVLNRDFVGDYIDATGAKFAVMVYGADKCQQLGRDLSRMAADSRLRRHRAGIQGLAGMGFPRWVWSYQLPKK